MMGERYNVSTENSFVLLGEDEMARDGFQAVKRRRNNTDQDQNSEQCVNGINKCVNGTSEEKLNFICEELCLIREGQDRISRGMLNFQQGFRYMNEKLCEVIEVTNTQSCALRTLAYKSIDLEARSRRNNLIFWGILENPGENCFQIIRDFIQHNLDLDSDRMYLARAHRLGPRKIGIRDPRRPIIVNFRDFIDTDTIMNKAFMLKNTPFSIAYDLPKEIHEARKRLWSELRTIKANKPFVKFQILYPAKLLVEGKVVRDEFPDWGKVMQGSRLVDFVHIDSHFSSDQPNTVAMEQPTASSVNMREQFMRDHILTSDTQMSRNNSVNPVNSQINITVSNHGSTISPSESQEMELDPHATVRKELDLPTADELVENSSMTATDDQSSLFRPLESSTGKNDRKLSDGNKSQNQVQNTSSTGRLSRSVQRVARRTHSLSVPRASQVVNSTQENPGVTINRNTSAQNKSQGQPNRDRSESRSSTCKNRLENRQSASVEKGTSN